MICHVCQQEFTSEWRLCPKNKPLLFCSRKCSNARIHSKETKNKISQSVSKYIEVNKNDPSFILNKLNTKNSRIIAYENVNGAVLNRHKIHKNIKCSFCAKQFSSSRRPSGDSWQTLCSDECYIASKSRNARGNKNIIYKGIRYDSSWEIDMVKFFEENRIEFIVPSPIVWVDSKNKKRKYFPDFYLEKYNLYVDPKNPLVCIKQEEKLKAVLKIINLIYGDIKYLKNEILHLIKESTNESLVGVEPSTIQHS